MNGSADTIAWADREASPLAGQSRQLAGTLRQGLTTGDVSRLAEGITTTLLAGRYAIVPFG